jgi:fructuronate reductase
VLALARAHDPGLAEWIASYGAFPCSMVDRIVPATTAEAIEAHAAKHGYRDEALVETERFCQWVLQDRFAGERPDFAAAGVTLTDGRRAVGRGQAAAAQRRAFGDRLPRRSRRDRHVHEFVASADRRD